MQCVELPHVSDSFNRGTHDAKLACDTGVKFGLAYFQAIEDSISYQRPNEYLHGFRSTYLAEREKRRIP